MSIATKFRCANSCFYLPHLTSEGSEPTEGMPEVGQAAVNLWAEESTLKPATIRLRCQRDFAERHWVTHSNICHLMLGNQNLRRTCFAVVINHQIQATELSHNAFAILAQINGSCRAERLLGNPTAKDGAIVDNKATRAAINNRRSQRCVV